MKTSRASWTLSAFALIMLIVAIATVCAPAYAEDSIRSDTAIPIPTPIPSQPLKPVPSYLGEPAAPKPVAAPPLPQNPFMSSGDWAAHHNNTYMSDTYYATSGPLGRSPIVSSTALGLSREHPAGLATGITFDRDGRLVTGVVVTDGAWAWVRLTLLDPADLAPLAALDLPKQPITDAKFRPAGTYFYQDQLDRIVVGTAERTIWVVSHACTGPDLKTCSFTPINNNPDPNDPDHYAYSLRDAVPESDEIEALQPDWSGLLWFTSKGGVVGTLNMDTGVVHSITLPGERIVNGTAADETGGIYIVSTRAMYRFDADPAGAPSKTWEEPYDAGTHLKAGQVDIGSGSTPTLMGEDYVAITDNAQPQMHVVVWRRAKDVQGLRLVCAEPVFKPGPSSNEQSLIATDQSIVVPNNYGYKDPKATQNGSTTKAGFARVDINANGMGCHTVWTNMDEIAPSVVNKMSLANGLIYTYTKPKGPANIDAWYFTAIDFETGRRVYSQLAGTGQLYDNNYAPVYLGPDGTWYVGVLGGLVALRDQQ